MKTYTVKQLARLAGVSVRTLHHYDEIGLLKPAFTGENRYRYYGEDEVLRLQQILIHRALDIPLSEIGAILDAPGFDRIEALRRQRESLETKAQRFAGMVRTIDRTIAHLTGDMTMKTEDLYSGLVPAEQQAGYEAWLVEKFGPGVRADIAQSREALARLGPGSMAAHMAGLEPIEQGIAEAMRAGLPPQSRALDPLIDRHRLWVEAAWARPCPPEAYAGLADVYGHPDFQARYEAIAPGLGTYLPAAMRAWTRRQQP